MDQPKNDPVGESLKAARLFVAILFVVQVLVGVAALIKGPRPPAPQAWPYTVFLPFAGLVLVIIGWFFLQGYIPRRVRRQAGSAPPSESTLIENYHANQLLAIFWLSNLGMFALIIYMVTADPIVLFVTAVALIGIAILFPRRSAYERFAAAFGGGVQ